MLATAGATSSSGLVYVNAGANKGFGVAEFLQRYHDDGGRAPSNREWHQAIKQIKPSGMFGCGMCSACKDVKPAATLRHNVSVRVVAFELLKPNHWLLTRLFERYMVPGVALNTAVSNYTGIAYAPTGVRTGQEWSTAELDGGVKRSKGWTAVSTTTIDAYAKGEGLERIHWLSIDAEGWDPLILEGTRRLFAEKRVDLVEFEYHHKGLWDATRPVGERRDLKAALSALATHGYQCFWQGDKGALARASGGAWCDSFEFRAHSNLVCSCRTELVEALDRVAVA